MHGIVIYVYVVYCSFALFNEISVSNNNNNGFLFKPLKSMYFYTQTLLFTIAIIEVAIVHLINCIKMLLTVIRCGYIFKVNQTSSENILGNYIEQHKGKVWQFSEES